MSTWKNDIKVQYLYDSGLNSQKCINVGEYHIDIYYKTTNGDFCKQVQISFYPCSSTWVSDAKYFLLFEDEELPNLVAIFWSQESTEEKFDSKSMHIFVQIVSSVKFQLSAFENCKL